MIRINNIKIRNNFNNKELLEYVIKKYKIRNQDVLSWQITKKSIDARKKDDVHFIYSMDFKLKNEQKYEHKFDKVKKVEFPKIIVNRKSNISPVIVGAGPAGLFCALTLVSNGIKPIIVEQGQSVDQRKKTVNDFLTSGKFNPLSNIQFGEGGAGTFSDGKLTTGINNPLCKKVLEEFVNFGAPEEILYLSKPHLGTDNLTSIVKNIRNYIISQGGTFLFNEKVIDINVNNGKISNVVCLRKNNTKNILKTDTAIFAIGHSSRDTFKMLYKNKLLMEPKNFSVGVRIEHLQTDINKSQYGTHTKLNLPPAEYKLAFHDISGRSCYTFCMCPGRSSYAIFK